MNPAQPPSTAPHHSASHRPRTGHRGHGGRIGALGQAEYGAAGLTFHAPPETRLALMQLTGPLSYPELTGAGASHFTVEPTPHAPARMLWLHQFDPADRDAANQPILSYGGASNAREETVYHPAAIRNGSGYAIGHPAFRSGDRALCFYNRQSGRWELLAPPLDVWRFELKTALVPGGNATAWLVPFAAAYDRDINVELTVDDAFRGGHRGRARVGTAPGAHGYAKFMPDSGRWEIFSIEHQARWIRFELTAALGVGNSGASANVLEHWDGYDPDPTHVGLSVTNLMVGSQYLFAGAVGAIGLACHEPEGGHYRIVQMGCPA